MCSSQAGSADLEDSLEASTDISDYESGTTTGVESGMEQLSITNDKQHYFGKFFLR